VATPCPLEPDMRCALIRLATGLPLAAFAVTSRSVLADRMPPHHSPACKRCTPGPARARSPTTRGPPPRKPGATSPPGLGTPHWPAAAAWPGPASMAARSAPRTLSGRRAAWTGAGGRPNHTSPLGVVGVPTTRGAGAKGSHRGPVRSSPVPPSPLWRAHSPHRHGPPTCPSGLPKAHIWPPIRRPGQGA
jgi:hypothetical protein